MKPARIEDAAGADLAVSTVARDDLAPSGQPMETAARGPDEGVGAVGLEMNCSANAALPTELP